MWRPENLFYARKGITIHRGGLSRSLYLRDKLIADDLAGIAEDKHAAYCAIALTQAPEDLKPEIGLRQFILLNSILKKAGLTTYDPGSALLSPDKGLLIPPPIIYKEDEKRIVSARFFTLLDILGSTGVGAEEQIAKDFNRMAVVLLDKGIRTSRMQPNRIIRLQYYDLQKQENDFIKVFQFLQQFEPGMGFDENHYPILLGFRGHKAYNLEKLIYQYFPNLEYKYDPYAPSIKLEAINPELLYKN